MTGRARSRHDARQRSSRAGSTIIGLGILLVIAVWAANLQAAEPKQGLLVDVGAVEDFPIGSVTTLEVRAGKVEPVTELEPERVSDTVMHIVRLPDGRVRAFSWLGTESGYAVWWMPDLVTYEPHGYFVDSGDGSRWYYDGGRAIGPAERNLDHYRVEVTDRGRVVIDITTVLPGGEPPDPPLRVRAAP